MPAATDQTGVMVPIDNCTVTIPGVGTLKPRILPDITDTKSATYNDEPVIGRSFPIKTYAHSDNRSISMIWHIVIVNAATLTEAIRQLSAFQSCVYPRTTTGQTPYNPPVICTISCGAMLCDYSNTATPSALCVVLKNYSVSYPTDVAYDASNMIPLKFDIHLQWEVVYATSKLPGQDMIIKP
jgi:hypothetical protein